MNLRQIIQASQLVLIYLVLQILFMRNLVLFNYAFSFVYIGIILLLPIETDRLYLLLIGFLVGILVDVFSNTLGMHAAATVLVAYLRPFLLHYQMESKGDDRLEIGIRSQGFFSFTGYMLPLIFIHSAVLFLLEINDVGMILYSLVRIVASTALTFVFILILELFSKR
ncbi:rod shape-determining protein MreD [Dyadobacter jejuensis]|uniref:Rod shape-determining protein MreD n=1 Tax=Dyadobacter jejuensis TaxID=1082580 RepID=A0A316AH86_9BACT|nr:hypothetical protein [Dyadobacter jejuensis]PWJ56638.1 rod shape-determining protein MreD [Dyadobacter jejuensis]